MKCPLNRRLASNDSGGWDEIPLYCLEAECGWWNTELESCTVKSLFSELSSLSQLIAELIAKLPYKAEFPKY